MVYKNGFSAVLVSSPFNSEFMEHASTAALPAYLPVDGHDLHVALTEIDRRLNHLYPGRLGNKALMGYSMGALESLFIAATGTDRISCRCSNLTATSPSILRCGCCMAFPSWMNFTARRWTGRSRNAADNLENTFLKVADLSQSTLTPQTSLPFDAIESKFLIGLNFRFELRDIIYSSQRRNNQGVLHHAIHNFRREPVYQEILQYSYQDYFDKFAVPYYSARGLNSPIAGSAGKSRRLADL